MFCQHMHPYVRHGNIDILWKGPCFPHYSYSFIFLFKLWQGGPDFFDRLSCMGYCIKYLCWTPSINVGTFLLILQCSSTNSAFEVYCILVQVVMKTVYIFLNKIYLVKKKKKFCRATLLEIILNCNRLFRTASTLVSIKLGTLTFGVILCKFTWVVWLKAWCVFNSHWCSIIWPTWCHVGSLFNLICWSSY